MEITIAGYQVLDELEKNYMVTFDCNGGKIDSGTEKIAKQLTYGSEYGEMPIPMKNGYTFDGWFTNVDGGEKVTKDSKISISNNHTLYAKWTSNIYNLNPVVNVNTLSKNTGDYFGGLYSSSLYKGSVYPGYGGKDLYSDNDGNLQYDEDGALLLDSDNAIPILEINNDYNIGEAYSILATIAGDINPAGKPSNDNSTIAAISDNVNNYLAWIGFYKGFLHVYSYYQGQPFWATTEQIGTGFASIDVSKYENKTINIQVTAVRNGKTKVYINGEAVCEFNSGNAKLDYSYLTIGDLRVGRGCKFIGKIYDFAIFDKILTEEQVKDNYERSKEYLSK